MFTNDDQVVSKSLIFDTGEYLRLMLVSFQHHRYMALVLSGKEERVSAKIFYVSIFSAPVTFNFYLFFLSHHHRKSLPFPFFFSFFFFLLHSYAHKPALFSFSFYLITHYPCFLICGFRCVDLCSTVFFVAI